MTRRLVLILGLAAPLACGGDDSSVASEDTNGSETGDTTTLPVTTETARPSPPASAFVRVVPGFSSSDVHA